MNNLDCCVSGCQNQRFSSTKVKFYRIPSRHQANRRRLWLQALQQANGSIKELKGNARVCDAHFLSRVASMDPNNPDFVPSVFTKQSPKRKGKRYFTGKRRRHHKINTRKENINSPSKANSPVDDQPSVLMDTNTELSQDMQTPPASSKPKDETEATTIESQASTPNKMPPLVKVSACIPNLNKMQPIVLLKRVVVPESGYWHETSNEDKQLHEEQTQLNCDNCGMLFRNQVSYTEHCCAINDEPSFPCNICDRSFTSSQYLKRHKLLHVKDARKCSKCGVLFCRRHNHVMFRPVAVALPETENEESSTDSKVIPGESNLSPEECHSLPAESNLKPQDSVRVMFRQSQPQEMDEGTRKIIIVTPLTTSEPAPAIHKPLTETHNVPLPVLCYKTLPKIPHPQLEEPFCTPYPHPPVHKPLVKENNLSELRPPPPLCPAAFLKHPELSTSLKIFSPQYLTSALLNVKRNYDYILSKKVVVKEKPQKVPLISPQKQNTKQVKKERIAYDMEIEI